MGKRGPKKGWKKENTARKIEPERRVIPVEDGRLNLGCGDTIRGNGWINIDKMLGRDDITYVDLEDGYLPFEDESCVEIHASHIMEHLHNFLPLMNECWRVLKPYGVLEIVVPILPHMEAFQDPTHVRYFTENTLKYFVGSEFLYKTTGKNYGIKPFKYMKYGKAGFELAATLVKG